MGAETDTRLRLSVVVPTLDEERTLPGLLDSLGGSSGSAAPDEILVVDGGSVDDTARQARERGIPVLAAAGGRGAQLAQGAEASVGELILFLHADARLRAGALGELRRAYEDPALIATGLRQAVAHPARFYRFVEAAANARARRGWIYGDSGLCVRRTAYTAAGGFRPLVLFEDLDLSIRLRRLGRIRLLENAVLEISARRWEDEGRLRRTFTNWALTSAYLVGVPPARLVRYYPNRRVGAPASAEVEVGTRVPEPPSPPESESGAHQRLSPRGRP